MSADTARKQDKGMQIVANLCFQNDDYSWLAYRVVHYKDELYLMTDSGHSGCTPFEYVEGYDFKDFIENTAEQFTDHVTGPLTRFQTLTELMSLLVDPDRLVNTFGAYCDIDDAAIEKAAHDILATNIKTTSLTKEEEAWKLSM